MAALGINRRRRGKSRHANGAAYARPGDLADVVGLLVAETVAPSNG